MTSETSLPSNAAISAIAPATAPKLSDIPASVNSNAILAASNCDKVFLVLSKTSCVASPAVLPYCSTALDKARLAWSNCSEDKAACLEANPTTVGPIKAPTPTAAPAPNIPAAAPAPKAPAPAVTAPLIPEPTAKPIPRGPSSLSARAL